MRFDTLLKNLSISRFALCLILFFGIGGGISKAANPYVRQDLANRAPGAATTLSVTFPNKTVAGDLILVGVDYTTSSELASISDSIGSTYTQVGAELTSPGGARSRVYSAQNVKAGNATVTVGLSATSAYIEIYVAEFHNVSATNPIDSQAGAAGNAGSVSSGLASTSVAGDVIWGYSVGDWASTVGSGFTALSTLDGNLMEDMSAGKPGLYAATATANSGWTMQMVALKPLSTGPVANVSPASLTFASQTVGTTGAAQTVTLTNSGTAALSITSIALLGTNAGDFVQTNTCGSSVAAGASCSINVIFKPAAAGTRTASLTINDNAPGGTQSVSLTGTGTSTASTPILSPTSLSFASQTVGSTSGTLTATLTNSGTAALSITSIALSGANAGDFSQSNNCGASLAAGAACSITLSFNPSASGTRAALLTVTDNAVGSPQTVSLSGTGASASTTVSVTPSSLSFGNESIAMTGTVQTVTVTNTGTSTLNLTSLAVTGANASDFAQTSTCGSSVAAGASCTIAVLFTPSASGARAAALSLSGNASGGSQTVSLSGSGSHDVMVSWADGSSGIMGYNVYRGTTAGGEATTPLNSVPVNNINFADQSVTPGTTYYYVVTAVAADGTQSPASMETSALVPSN